MWVAEATRHDEVAADAAVMLVGTTGLGLSRFDESERWARFAEAILKRMGPGHERLKGWLAHNRGTSRVIADELAAARTDLLAAIALKRKTDGGDSPDVAVSMNSLADLHERRGDYSAAVRSRDQARAIYERVYGPEHIFVARAGRQSLRVPEQPRPSCRSARVLPKRARDLGAGARTRSRLARLCVDRHRCRARRVAATGEALAPLRTSARHPQAWRVRQQTRAPRRGSRSRARCGRPAAIAPSARDAAETARSEYAKAPGTGGKLRDVDAWLVAHDARGAPVARRVH